MAYFCENFIPVFNIRCVLKMLVHNLNCVTKQSFSFLQDGLVRQSLTTQKADALLKSVAKTMCNVKHDLKVANQLLASLLSKVGRLR